MRPGDRRVPSRAGKTDAPYIPISKERGFTALSIKGGCEVRNQDRPYWWVKPRVSYPKDNSQWLAAREQWAQLDGPTPLQ